MKGAALLALLLAGCNGPPSAPLPPPEPFGCPEEASVWQGAYEAALLAKRCVPGAGRIACEIAGDVALRSWRERGGVCPPALESHP